MTAIAKITKAGLKFTRIKWNQSVSIRIVKIIHRHVDTKIFLLSMNVVFNRDGNSMRNRYPFWRKKRILTTN